MAQQNVSIDQVAVFRYLTKVTRPYMQELADTVAKKARETAPTHDQEHGIFGGGRISTGTIDTVPLGSTIETEVRETARGMTAIIRSRSRKARMVHEGTGVRTIVATKPHGALIFFWRGQLHYVTGKKSGPGIVRSQVARRGAEGSGGKSGFYPRGAQPWLANALNDTLRERQFLRRSRA